MADEAVRGKHRKRRRDWINRRQPFMRQHRHKLVFIDETSVNTKLYRTRGRALKGQRLHTTGPMGGWKTQTFIAGLRQYEMIAPWVINGPMNKAAFESYGETQLATTLDEGDVVILDNLSSHKSKRAAQLLKKKGCWFSCSCPHIAQTSTLSKWHFPSSKLTFDASAQEPSKT